jgi:acylphosphatase
MQWKDRNNMKLKIIITGSKVHDVGYRVMLVNKALSLGVNNFNVFNTFFQGNQAVFAVIEGDEDVLEEFKDHINTVKPDKAEVGNISFEEYGNAIPPIERVMQAFQMEQWGKGIPILLKMLEKQDKMLEKQDSVIERQDTTIGILKSVKEDTTHIPAMKQDTSEIKSNTREIVDKLQNKYEEMSREIAQIKITLSKIEAKVFS